VTLVALVAAFGTAAVGALGGLGGAIILVPFLVVFGWAPAEAAPLGLISVAAGSLAAGAIQLGERTVNHRIGVVTELAASSGAIVGALMAGVLSDSLLQLFLAGVAFVAAIMTLRRVQELVLAHHPHEVEIGERVGGLSGAFVEAGSPRRYEATHLPGGLAVMSVAGLVAGMAGAGGGFLKTPATVSIMGVPVRVAAATTTFTIGITAATGLLVFALQGRIDAHEAAAVALGSLLGGRAGAALQTRLSTGTIRRALGALLVLVGIILVVRS